MKYLKKIAALTAIILSASLLFATISAGAWGWGPIKPGDHVFDAKRFADSVRETAQMLQTVQNTLENLKNRIIANTKVDPYFDRVNAEIEKIQLPGGDSLINPDNEYKDTLFWKTWEIDEAIADREYNTQLADELETTNKEMTDRYQEAINNQFDRDYIQSAIIGIKTPGIVGEKQKGNSSAVLNSTAAIDKAQMSGAAQIQEITNQEAAVAADRLDKEKIKQGSFYGYDPYNPTDYDRDNRPPVPAPIGYIRFGE